MTDTQGPNRETAAPDASIVHLSGRRRGATQFLSGDHIVIVSTLDGGVELSTTETSTPRSLAVLDRRGHTFRLTATPGADVWVNGEQLEELVLASGDVLEFEISSASATAEPSVYTVLTICRRSISCGGLEKPVPRTNAQQVQQVERRGAKGSLEAA